MCPGPAPGGETDRENGRSRHGASESGAPAEAEPPELPRREDAHAITVVGVGGSAGSIPALEVFFQSVPEDTGSAYVVVLHLAPEHESRLAELLSRSTRLPVLQVTDTVQVEPGHVYVIPPGKHLEMRDGYLGLRPLDPAPSGTRVAVDTFFYTLADAHGPQAAAVVLSGTGADGSLGLRRVKEAGGLAVAQSPGEAEYDAMPRHAIATGVVDFVLPAANMPAQIESYWQTSKRMRLPEEAAPSPEQREDNADAEAALREILGHVRVQTGHDFARYKRATVLRRIGRRLQVCGLESLPEYVQFLRRHPAEVGSLVGDLLISVTQFFRDPPSWDAVVREVLPRLFRDKQSDEDPVRAWVCGCATGEEAYTLAVLLLEEAARRERRPRIQIFATDMDHDAVAKAREGIYPETVAAHISEERLRRWFYRHSTGMYQVRKEVRECVLFAHHDVLKDTPFSRLDLITCRNLLIYLNREAQEQVFDTFHFALRPDGHLMLGPSESAESAGTLFGLTDKQHRVYVRRPVARTPIIPQSLPSSTGRWGGPWEGRTLGVPPHSPPLELPPVPTGPELAAGPTPRPVAGAGELHRSLLELYAPPSVLIGADHEIIHLSDRVGRFLRVGGGEPTRNLVQLVHPDLRIDLRTLLYTAGAEGSRQVRLSRAVPLDGEGAPPVPVRLTVRPVETPEGARGYFLVLFEELPAGVAAAAAAGDAAATAAVEPADSATAAEAVRQLEEENATLQRQLRSTIEQYEAITEELKASNEELQAMNEEQRSAAEELETSKEELQSLNEELSTLNHELRVRVDEVSRANSDLQNFLSSTDIGTIFLDRALQVKRFTPRAESLFHLIPTDVGRPLVHLASRLDYPNLQEDAEGVLARLAPVEREIASRDSERHFLARLLPYRSLDDRIEGVVVNFIDITERKRAEQAMHASEERLRLIIESAEDYAIFTLDLERRVTSWSSGAEAVFGYGEAEILGSSGDVLFTPEDLAQRRPLREVETALREGCADNERWHVRRDGTRFFGSGTTRPLQDAAGSAVGFVKIMRDLTEQKEAEERLRESEEQFRRAIEEAPIPVIMHAEDGQVLQISRTWTELTGYTLEDVPTLDAWLTLAYGEGADAVRDHMHRLFEGGNRSLTMDFTVRTRTRGQRHWRFSASSPGTLRDGRRFIVGMAVDITERIQAQAAADTAARANQELEQRVAERTRILTERTEELARMSELRRELLRQLVLAQEQERGHMARDLHDDTGQQVTGLLLGLARLGKMPAVSADPAAQETLAQLEALAGEVAEKAHRLAVTLRPTALDDLGLVPAVKSFAQEWSGWSGVPVEVEAVGLETRLPQEVETTVYRVVQEALTNVMRHASPRAGGPGADRVSVLLQRRDHEVRAVVEDNGPGFDVDAALNLPPGQRRLGIFGMQERARLAGGTLSIESASGEGTTVLLQLPLPETETPHE